MDTIDRNIKYPLQTLAGLWHDIRDELLSDAKVQRLMQLSGVSKGQDLQPVIASLNQTGPIPVLPIINTLKEANQLFRNLVLAFNDLKDIASEVGGYEIPEIAWSRFKEAAYLLKRANLFRNLVLAFNDLKDIASEVGGYEIREIAWSRFKEAAYLLKRANGRYIQSTVNEGDAVVIDPMPENKFNNSAKVVTPDYSDPTTGEAGVVVEFDDEPNQQYIVDPTTLKKRTNVAATRNEKHESVGQYAQALRSVLETAIDASQVGESQADLVGEATQSRVLAQSADDYMLLQARVIETIDDIKTIQDERFLKSALESLNGVADQIPEFEDAVRDVRRDATRTVTADIKDGAKRLPKRTLTFPGYINAPDTEEEFWDIDGIFGIRKFGPRYQLFHIPSPKHLNIAYTSTRQDAIDLSEKLKSMFPEANWESETPVVGLPQDKMIEIKNVIEQFKAASLKIAKDRIPGGKADTKEPDDFNLGQMETGIEIEQEHTDDPAVAQEIAMDHLEEFPDYYDALQEMETKLKEPVQLVPVDPVTEIPLLNDLRDRLKEEQDAINKYEIMVTKLLERDDLQGVRSTLEHISIEEKQHSGELQELIRSLDHVQSNSDIQAPSEIADAVVSCGCQKEAPLSIKAGQDVTLTAGFSSAFSTMHGKILSIENMLNTDYPSETKLEYIQQYAGEAQVAIEKLYFLMWGKEGDYSQDTSQMALSSQAALFDPAFRTQVRDIVLASTSLEDAIKNAFMELPTSYQKPEVQRAVTLEWQQQHDLALQASKAFFSEADLSDFSQYPVVLYPEGNAQAESQANEIKASKPKAILRPFKEGEYPDVTEAEQIILLGSDPDPEWADGIVKSGAQLLYGFEGLS